MPNGHEEDRQAVWSRAGGVVDGCSAEIAAAPPNMAPNILPASVFSGVFPDFTGRRTFARRPYPLGLRPPAPSVSERVRRRSNGQLYHNAPFDPKHSRFVRTNVAHRRPFASLPLAPSRPLKNSRGGKFQALFPNKRIEISTS